jgi:hypothetical protein
MAEPAEEQAIVALVAALESGLADVGAVDWDYAHTPNVRRAPLPPLGQQMKADDCPVVYVVPGQDSGFQAGAYDGKRQRMSHRYDLHVDLHGCVFRESTGEVLADTERWRFRSHIADLVMRNRHLGGISTDGIRFGDRRERVDEGAVAPNAWFLLPITIPLSLAFATTPA